MVGLDHNHFAFAEVGYAGGGGTGRGVCSELNIIEIVQGSFRWLFLLLFDLPVLFWLLRVIFRRGVLQGFPQKILVYKIYFGLAI